MKKQRHQALQRGSSFSVNSRSEEEAFSILVSSLTNCFFPTLPLSQSQCKKISGQRKGVWSLLLHRCRLVDKRGRAPSCWPTAPCRRSLHAPPPSNTLPHAPSFHPYPLTAHRLPIVRAPAHPVFPDYALPTCASSHRAASAAGHKGSTIWSCTGHTHPSPCVWRGRPRRQPHSLPWCRRAPVTAREGMPAPAPCPARMPGWWAPRASPAPGGVVSQRPDGRKLEEKVVHSTRNSARAEACHDVWQAEPLQHLLLAAQLRCRPASGRRRIGGQELPRHRRRPATRRPRLAAAQHADTPELPHPQGIHASPVLSSPPWHHVLSSRWTPHRRPPCVRCNANKNRDSHAVSTVKQHATGPRYRRCNSTKPLTCCHCSLPPPPSSCFLPPQCHETSMTDYILNIFKCPEY